ncbi:MAG: spermidine/putrescine ABC transporter substrate-binding protein [Acidimicrobiia bacterium]|jgi:spermidine/putrescine transport system substrate-binding protein|nr:spermidine/putrescine ABC transporter substrate-binding protein [Acidimicrobiia bacterium]
MSTRRRTRTSNGITRREFIGRGGAVVGGMALGATLLGTGSNAVASRLGDGVGGKLSVLNWPLYIDEKKKLLKDFEAETGTSLKYSETLNDNNEFFAKYQRQLSQGQYPGFDIAAPTSWMAKRLIDLGYVQKLPFDNIPNAANLSPGFQNPPWDPSGEFTLPWQTGMSGIAYNIKITGRELTSFSDLYDKKFKNKIGMLLEMRDTVGLACLGEGVDPATVTYKKAKPALDRLQKAVDAGQVRRFTGNDYQDDLVAGNFAACVSWSGDVAQLTLDNEDLRFVIPDAGGMRWADTMVWIKSAKREPQVAAWMNFFYDQANAAFLAAWLQYISPVDGIETELAKIDPALAQSPLIFPPEDVQARLKVFNQELSAKDEEKFDQRFAEITGS